MSYAATVQNLQQQTSKNLSLNWAAWQLSQVGSMQQQLQKNCWGYELFGNRTKFAAAHKQEIEFGLSCMAIVTGGQQAAKAPKKGVSVMSYAATVQHLQQHTRKNLSLGCKSYAARV
jgi:hypothetical protein